MNKSDCIFCKIIKGEIESEIVYQDEQVICFKDNNPQANVHLLLMPKNHYEDILDLAQNGSSDMQALAEALTKIVCQEDLASQGFRLINNCGAEAGQSVFHVHFHLLSDASKLKDTLV